jgi:hypothetical protein
MHYRVAIQGDTSPTWQWNSTPLSSLNILLHWLQYYRTLPHDRLRIFSSSSRETLNEQLVRENQGLLSTSVPAIQFLQERRMSIPGRIREASPSRTQVNGHVASIAALPEASPCESSRSSLERRREELERGAGGDHDLPYRFTVPSSLSQVLAWVKLLARVRSGDLQPEVVAL